MKLGENEWFRLSLAVLILAGIASYKFALWLLKKLKLAMNTDSIESSVDPPGFGSKRVVKKSQVKVEFINGLCLAENGDEKLSARCNAVLAEMNAFHREFLLRVPEGKPNTAIFTEVVLQDERGDMERKAYFEAAKEKENVVKRLWKRLKPNKSY